MQDLADLAAVFIAGKLRRGRRIFEDRRREMPGEMQIVMVPAEQDGLEQHREEAEPCG